MGSDVVLLRGASQCLDRLSEDAYIGKIGGILGPFSWFSRQFCDAAGSMKRAGLRLQVQGAMLFSGSEKTGSVLQRSHHLARLCSFMTAVLRVSEPCGCVLSSSNVSGFCAESLATPQAEFYDSFLYGHRSMPN